MLITQSERLNLRLFTQNDAAMILELVNQPNFIKYIGDKNIRTIDDATKYINDVPLAMQTELGFSLYCCELKQSGKAIGMCGLIKRDGIDHPEIGFSILSDYYRQGLIFEASEAVVHHTKKTLALPCLQAIVNPDNDASLSLLERLGFYRLKQITLPEGDDVILHQLDL